jgi:hypothetical protein
LPDDSLELAPRELDLDRLLLIVVGSHLRAETADRPIAYKLRERTVKMMSTLVEKAEDEQDPVDIVVCTDVWWLNNDGLRECPTISIGGPGVNALSAYLGDKLPSAFVVDDQMIVQMDVELSTEWVCIWGVDHERTVAVCDIFADRYLERFLRTVLERLEED